jgi:GntR family transcriptional regulator
MLMSSFAWQTCDYSPSLTGFGRCDRRKHARPDEVHGRRVAARPACLFGIGWRWYTATRSRMILIPLRDRGRMRRYIVFMVEVPLYGKVEEVLASEIGRGDLQPGDRLPSEEELLARFGVSRITVRRAIQNLIQRGVLEIRRGLGTFVLAPKISQELTKLTGFVEDMDIHGRKASARVVSKGAVAANETVAHHLGINKGTRVMRIERVRLADSVPMSFDETYLPLDIGKKIVRNDLRVKPIFTLLEEKYGFSLVEAEYRLEAAAASAQVAEALAVPEGSPIFRIERTSFTRGGQPIDYEILSYRGDLIRFVTRLARRPGLKSAQPKAARPLLTR